MKFTKAIDKFVLLHQSEDWNAETQRYYKGKIPNIRKYLGDHNVLDIDKYTIAEFTKSQRDRNPDISNTTLNRYRDITVRILREICDHDIKIKKLREKVKIIKNLKEDVVNTILDHLYTNRNLNKNFKEYYKYYFMFNLMLETGVRISEVINIKISNIDIHDRSIFLDVTKYDKERYVFFPTEIVDIYMKYIHRYGIKDVYLFPSNNQVRHLTRNTVMRFIRRLQKRLGMEKSISSHKWRHTFASRFIENGGSLPILQDLLGHENIETTMIYVHMNKNQLKTAYDENIKNRKAKR